MKIFKKKFFWIILIILVIAGGISLSVIKNSQKTPVYTTAKVMSGKLTQTVSATGSVESATEINLNFKTTGKIGQLLVKVGDQVKAGQLLATLEAGAQQSQVANAQAAVAVAQANLDKIIAGSSSQDIEVSQKSVESAHATLTAKNNNLTNLQATRDLTMTNLRETALNDLDSKYFVGLSSLQTVNDTINYEDAETTLGISNMVMLNTVNQNYPTTVTHLNNTTPVINSAKQTKTDADIISAIDNLKSVLNEISTLADETFQVLQATTISPTLSVTELDGLKSGITTVQTNLNTGIGTLQTDRNNLLNTEQDYDTKIKAAQDEVTSAQAALNLAQAQLDLKKAGPRDFEISYYRAQLQQAQASLQSAYSNLADYSLSAPTNGTITKINTEKGEQSSLTTPVIVMMAESNLQIEVDIPESDIAKIKIGDKASITLDAFGEDRVFNGTITLIDPAATVIQDVVYYKVKVIFEKIEEDVKPGMTANIDILTQEKNDVLMIPTRAIKEVGNKKIVQILVNNAPEDREIVTGLKGDEAMTEVISGLNEGEEIITFVKNGQ